MAENQSNNLNQTHSIAKENMEVDAPKIKRVSRINVFLNKYFRLIIIFVVFVILVGSFFLVIIPKYQETLTIIKGNLANQEDVYVEQWNKLNNYKKLVSVYEKISVGERQKVENILPLEYIKEQLFIELGYIIPQNGYVLNSLEFHKDKEEIVDLRRAAEEISTEELLLQKLPRSIGYIKGTMATSLVDYAGLKNLIYILENNLKLIDIYNVGFNPETESVEIDFITYYLNL